MAVANRFEKLFPTVINAGHASNRVRLLATLFGALMLGLSAPAAALTQPGGAPIPSPMGCDSGRPTGLAAVLACVCEEANVCNIGDPCPDASSCSDGKNGSCETTLYHSYNDNTCIPSNLSGLDPSTQASTEPETFRPDCPLTFTLLSRGTALFKDAFGWYNVTGQKPALSDLHPMLDCNTTAGDDVVLDLASEPAYAGGEIGFFLVTPENLGARGSCQGGDCCATVPRAMQGNGQIYFSERKYNPDFQGSSSLIHLIVLQSEVWPSKFYFAWEDIYGGSNNDFTDFVAGVSGIQCSGGGLPCDASGQGACAQGITRCHGADLTCDPLFEATGEACNGIDDDCNGEVDDDASCPPNEVCQYGKCAPSCSSGEFPCSTGRECEESSGLCVDAGCVDKDCAPGDVCTQGECRAACAGVVCPASQDCIADRCVDLCDAVVCAAGQQCRRGQCFDGCNQCGGISCELPLRCDGDTGACRDPSCDPACTEGTRCDQGSCVDACEGVSCPPGQVCSLGQCRSPGEGGTGGMAAFGGAGGSGASLGGDAGSAPSAGTGGSGADAARPPRTNNTARCICGLGRPDPESKGFAWLGLLGGLIGVVRRRRSQRQVQWT
ncbi:MAG: DUF4114 domain-containing protein [Myxococcales bacterium]|nr:DUF4114 domain-containing protein [Myxococcales bacterium]